MAEKIKAAAIKYRIKGETEFKYVTGFSHGSCIEAFSCMDLLTNKRDMDVEEQGFMTNANMFVSREEAAKIAKNAGQVIKGYNKERLDSYDIILYEND